MGHGRAPNADRLVEQVDPAPVGQPRHQQHGEALERGGGLERLGEDAGRLGQEGDPTSGRLGCLSGGALTGDEAGVVDGQRREPGEVLGDVDVVGTERPSARRGQEEHGAERVTASRQRHREGRAESQLAKQAHGVGVCRRGVG